MARRPKENKLVLRWDEKQKDFLVWYPRKCDGALVMRQLISDILEWRLPINEIKSPSNYEVTNFKDELERRGYDLKTLRFEISLKE